MNTTIELIAKKIRNALMEVNTELYRLQEEHEKEFTKLREDVYQWQAIPKKLWLAEVEFTEDDVLNKDGRDFVVSVDEGGKKEKLYFDDWLESKKNYYEYTTSRSVSDTDGDTQRSKSKSSARWLQSATSSGRNS